MNKGLKESLDYPTRTCDALVLAYSPSQILAKGYGRNFYIPSQVNIEEAFGDSLRKIFGKKECGSHWADAVEWGTIANLEKLEKRILQGTKLVINGDPDYQTWFGQYFSLSNKLDHLWVSGLGDLYRFQEGERKKAIQEFESYWTNEEKSRWKQIQGFMRKHTKEKFNKK